MFWLFLVLDNTKNAAHGSDSSKSAERVRALANLLCISTMRVPHKFPSIF